MTGAGKAAPSKDLCRKYDLIFALGTIPKPDIQLLQKSTDIPMSTLKRQLGILRNDFGMHIDFHRTPGAHGGSGYYAVSNWGFIDKDQFLNFWAAARPRPLKDK